MPAIGPTDDECVIFAGIRSGGRKEFASVRNKAVTTKESERDLITRVAWLYYKNRLTQQEIGERVSLSRQKVQRLLEKARDLEIIRFNLKHPEANLLGVEQEMIRRFDLRDAVVVPTFSSDVEELRRAYAQAGAYYLERLLSELKRGVLGMGWGNTTAYFAEYFDPQRDHGKFKIVSLIGNLMTNVSMNPYISAERIAEKLDAPFYNIWAPAIAHSKQRAEVFRSEPWIEKTLSLAADSNIMVLSVGEVSDRASLFKMGYLTHDDLTRLMKKGAVGDILSRFFDAEGNVVDDEVHDRVIGIPIELVKSDKKTVIGVAGGASKILAIRAALSQKYVNVLITDEWSAGELLKTR